MPVEMLILSFQPMKIISLSLIKKIVFYHADMFHRMHRHRIDTYVACRDVLGLPEKKR